MFKLIDFIFKFWHFILSIAIFILFFPLVFSFIAPVIPFILLPIILTLVEFGLRKALKYQAKKGELLSVGFLAISLLETFVLVPLIIMFQADQLETYWLSLNILFYIIVSISIIILKYRKVKSKMNCDT